MTTARPVVTVPLRFGLRALVLTADDVGPPSSRPAAEVDPEHKRRRLRAASAERFRRSLPLYYPDGRRVPQ